MEATSSRFVIADQEEVAKDVAARVPENTRKKVKWAINLLRDWHNEWKQREDDIVKVEIPLEVWSMQDLNKCLCVFVNEVSLNGFAINWITIKMFSNRYEKKMVKCIHLQL